VTVDELLDRLADWDARSSIVISGISPDGDSVNERVFNLYTRGRPTRQDVIRRAQRTGQKSSGLPDDIGELVISWQHSEHAEKLRELRCEMSGSEQARTSALGWSTTSWPENRGPITVHELIGALVLLDPRSLLRIEGISPDGDTVSETDIYLGSGQGPREDIDEIYMSWQHSEEAEMLYELRCEEWERRRDTSC
jgi:hypothetical protein